MGDLLLAAGALLGMDLVLFLVDWGVELYDRYRRHKAWREAQKPMGYRTAYPSQLEMDISVEMVNRGRGHRDP